MKSLFAKLVRDEDGTETLEYALVIGLIVVACITIIAGFGTRVLARWNSANGSF